MEDASRIGADERAAQFPGGQGNAGSAKLPGIADCLPRAGEALQNQGLAILLDAGHFPCPTNADSTFALV